jgi:hypothetical protein
MPSSTEFLADAPILVESSPLALREGEPGPPWLARATLHVHLVGATSLVDTPLHH